MMQLPKDQYVDTGLLSSVFNHTTASYKFYWFLSILESVEQVNSEKRFIEIAKHELFARMIANAWYTVNNFHLSFGAHDKIEIAINKINEIKNFEIDERKDTLASKLINSSSRDIHQILNHFDKNVPFKFLSPWLGTGAERVIKEKSQENYNLPPYSLYDDRILIQPAWFDYFRRNSGLLKDFCYWNLALFLAARNPNVPNIPNKLIRPLKRQSLLNQKKEFWDLVITHKKGSIDCIYTNSKLGIGEYAVEHFIPFQFVTHDLMWNLIPASPSFNSIKSDKLPDLNTYFKSFYEVQKEAVSIIKLSQPKNKFLSDYLVMFDELIPTEEKYRSRIEPLISIAYNNGFEFLQ
jgi:hypothetical protein